MRQLPLQSHLVDNFDDFVKWCSFVRYHESLDTKHYLQNPDDAFWARLPQARLLKMFLNIAEEEFNVKSEYKNYRDYMKSIISGLYTKIVKYAQIKGIVST